jgi:tetratricopeptide (TPR) repeat protein
LITGTLLFLRKPLGFGGSGSMVADFGVAILIAVTAAACGVLLGIIWAPYIGAWVARPLSDLFDGGRLELEPQPLYARAEACRKRGHHLEAIAAVQAELARFPGDFAGTLLLADIHAEDLKDLAQAQEILEAWMAGPGRGSDRIAVALHRIADWQLRLGRNPEAARATLERIVHQLPETEAAHLAAQRLAHLTSAAMLAEQAAPHPIPLGQYAQDLGIRRGPPPNLAPAEDPGSTAAAYVKHLEAYPDDNNTRECLARLYAEHYGRLDLARREIERLLDQPHAPERQMARWLNLLADFELLHGGDETAARATLQRIIDRSPRSAAAENARQRLVTLSLEARRKKPSQTLRLGSLENPPPDSGSSS